MRKISQYVHDKWGADRGFVGGTVYAINQSADGYLWIGTERGLVRFDGFKFTLIQRPLPDDPPTGPVRRLLSDAEGNLWIPLEGPHMLLYQNGRFEDAFNKVDLRDVTVTSAAADREGDALFSGLGERTVLYHDGKTNTLLKAGENPGIVISLAVTRDRRIWLGTTDNGLFRISEGHLSRVFDELKNDQIRALQPSSGRGIWIGTEHGLKYWDGDRVSDTAVPASIEHTPVLALAKDQDENIWVGTDHGMVRITAAGLASLELFDTRTRNAVKAIFQDRDGDLWYGGEGGIERLRNGMFTSYTTADGLPSNTNGAVYVDSDARVWFAPLSGGLWWMKDGQIGSISAGGLDHDVVYSITGLDGEIWVGRQRGGLTSLRRKGDSFEVQTYNHADGLAQDSVYSVHGGRDGSIWAGTVSAGVSRFKDGKFTNFSEKDGLVSNSINAITEGSDGTMWFSTPNGLSSDSNGRWEKYSLNDGLPATNVKTTFEDSDQVIWIATSAGLAFMSRGTIRVPQKVPETMGEQILGIAEDSMSMLWFTTSDHVLRVNREHLLNGELSETDVQSYGFGDGLKGVEGGSRDRTVVADSQGRIWTSLNRGLSVADPKVSGSNSIPVTVRIESMIAGHDHVSLQTIPRLSSGTQSVTLNYGNSNLAMPERIRYRYKLDGSDRNWNDIVASQQVVYSNLGPGTFHFHIVASNTDGLWNSPEEVISFIIEPAFWQTWWFRIVCAIVLCLVFLGFYQLRMVQLTQRLNVRFRERLAERTRIAQDLHDTLLQGVLSASLQLDVADDQLPDGSPVKPLLRRVLQLMSKVTEEGRNTLRGLRASESNNRNLEIAFSRMRQEIAMSDRIGYRIIVSSETRPLRPIIHDEVYRIGREALVNALRHADARSVEVELEYASKYLRMMIRDDGRGIDPDVLQSGLEGHWGLVGMRERSEGIGASLRLRSRVGAGTEVELTVPSAIAFESESTSRFTQWFHWFKKVKLESRNGDERKRAKE